MGSNPGDSHEDRTLDPDGENCSGNPVIIGEVDPDLGGLLGRTDSWDLLPKILEIEKLADIFMLFVFGL